ncbi:SCY1-like protein 2 isoform X2 [Tubulanus polymorphus]
MDMIYKIKNTVSGALPGNPVTREFDVGNHVASAGPGCLWKIYDAMKKTTKQEASVFMFEKKLIDRYSKKDKEIIVSVLKKGVANLTRLRHPKILSVLHPIEESRDSLAFATERVFASLANMLGNCDNVPNPLPAELKDCKLFDVEIKYGLLQITDGLTFLHNDVKMLHKNVCPESIVVVKNGAWKLSGFDFSLPNIGSADQPAFTFIDWEPELPHVAQPALNNLAPEYKLTGSCSIASDMFSFGVLMYAVFNQGKPLYECNNQISTFDKNVQELRRMKVSLLGSIPSEVRDHVKMLLNAEPSVRPDANQLSKIPFFEDVGVTTLQYLDSMIQHDNLQKSQFFKGLPQVVVKLPKRVHLQRILPCLFSEFVNADMVPFVLPSILAIAEQITDSEYVTHCLPLLKPAFAIENPVQISLIFMQNMSLLLQKTPPADVKNHILPMIFRALESNSPQIQEICLSVIPTFASLIEYSSMKNAILPRIRKLCLATSLLGVRVNCLVCIGQLLEYMDKWFVLDEVLPMLTEIPSREPAVLMSILGIYQVAFSHKKLGITKDILATKTLPFLLPLCIDSNLNLKQFNGFISVIKDMIGRVESEHRSKLEQLDSMQQEQRTINFGPEHNPNNLVPTEAPKSDTMMDRFLSGFGISSVSISNSSSGDSRETDTKKSPTSPTSQTPKATNLTMEEKQRLAREQEAQQRMKTQAPITAKSTPTANKPRVKDLTSSLVNSNFMDASTGLNSNRAPNYNISTTHGQGVNYNPSGPGMASTSTMYGPAKSNSFSGGIGQPSYGAAAASQMPPKQATVDLSAFDSLLQTSSNQPRPSLNQIARPAAMTQQQPYMGYQQQPQQGFMGQQQPQRMIGYHQGVMGSPAGMIPQPGGMANQYYRPAPGPQSNQGFFGNLAITNGQQQQSVVNQQRRDDDFDSLFGGGPSQQSINNQNKPKPNDISDIFG